MSVISTPAIVLHAFPYGESSKIVRLATPDHGVLSAIAKGAQRAKSKFGARLQPMSGGVAQLYIRPNRDLQTLAEFDIEHDRLALAHDVARYASAAALGELVLRFAPEEPHPEIFALLAALLDLLLVVDVEHIPAASLGALWSIVGVLGFAPALDGCAVDGCLIEPGAVDFSVADGGFVCARCGASRETSRLGADDREMLEGFVRSEYEWGGVLEGGGRRPRPGTPPLDPRHAAAHRRLLSHFIRLHVAEGRDLKALDFWGSLPWRDTS